MQSTWTQIVEDRNNGNAEGFEVFTPHPEPVLEKKLPAIDLSRLAPARKTPAKKTAAKKTAARKTAAKKTAARKTAAKKA